MANLCPPPFFESRLFADSKGCKNNLKWAAEKRSISYPSLTSL